MPVKVEKYGPIIEITEYEKTPRKVRLPSARKGSDVYLPKRPDNIRRTKKTCLRRVLSAIEDFGNPLLVTLTFEGDASDASYANDSLRSFQVRLRNKYPKAESLFMAFSLTCRCVSEIRAKVGITYPMEMKEKLEPLPNYGDAVSWMQKKLTGMSDWVITFPST